MKLGEFLRSERLRKGIDLETASEETRIKEVYIRALEEENYDLIPGEIYQRHYFKSYLEYLGHEELYYRLTRERPKTTSPSEKMVRKPTEDVWDTTRYMRIALRLAMLVIFIVLFVFIVSMGISKLGGRAKASGPVEIPVQELEIPLPLPKPMDDVDAKIAAALGPKADLGDVQGQIDGAFDEHTVKFEFTGECWLTVKGPNGQIFTGLMKDGDVKEFGPERWFLITLGLAKNALVYFDDIHVYGGDMGQPPGMTFSFPADYKFNKDILINPLDQVTGNGGN